MVDEKDEDLNADKETFNRLYTMIGGFPTLFILAITTIFFQYFGLYQESVTQNWSDATPEDQATHYMSYMTKIALVGILSMVLHKVREIMFRKAKKSLGRDVHRVTLERVLLAPVNTFFDVTPMGKILNIFTRNMDVFYGRIIEPLQHMMNMLAHVLVVFYFLFTLGNCLLYIPVLTIMFFTMRKIATPYLHADNQLHKVGSTLWTPIHSYFHESMRGKSIIRAF